LFTSDNLRSPSIAAPPTHFEKVFKSFVEIPPPVVAAASVLPLESLVFGLCDFKDTGLSPPSEFVIVFVTLSFPFFAANAKPRKPLATISEEAMAIAKRAAVVFLLNIGVDDNAMFLRNVKVNKRY
jgi:hypothetical protein